MLVHSLLAAALALAAADAPKEDSKKDLDKLQGTWAISTITYDGGDVPADIVSKLRFEVKDDLWTVKGEDEVAKEYGKATLKLDASVKPRLIDFNVGAGSEKGTDIEGIYEWNEIADGDQDLRQGDRQGTAGRVRVAGKLPHRADGPQTRNKGACRDLPMPKRSPGRRQSCWAS